MKIGTILLLGLLASSAALADNFSFQGTFTSDDNVQLFTFAVGSTSTVTLQTWSYAGGVDAQGVAIPRGGFDPILALFNSAGAEINQNDDGGSNVPADSVTGEHYDTYLQSTLAPGTYTVSVMEYDNFAIGPNLSDGFTRTGQGDFTAAFGCSEGKFCDVSGDPAGNSRNGNWEFDILGVNSATTGGGGSTVPEPASVGLLLLGVGALAAAGRKIRAHR
ncbi:MAG TPA: DVUA0089 family protein [Bryobacteraceae bacterium]|nr:DVUA0089 family protein [Bryobacteraceae bacterium]